MVYLIVLAAFALVILVIGFRSRQVWPIGAAMVEVSAIVVYLLFALWPVRLSDLPPGVAQAPPCASPSPSPVASASPSPAQRTPSPTPSPVPTATPLPSASIGPGGLTGDQRQAAQATIQAQLQDPWVRCAVVFGYPTPLPFETRLLIIVALAAALGSLVHVATSFSAFLGNGTYDPRWLWWYVLRIPIGVALAFVFYFAIRGGILTTTSLSTSDVNPFGLAAIAGLVGLFSKTASDKLEEVFKTLFKTEGDAQRTGKLGAIAPAIIDVTPAKIDRKSPPDKLSVYGANFRTDVKVSVDGQDRKLTRKDDRNLDVPLLAADVAAPKDKVTVTITNTDPDKSATVSQDVPITDPASAVVPAPAPAANPAPNGGSPSPPALSIASVAPETWSRSAPPAGNALTVTGSNFDPDVEATINGTQRTVSRTDDANLTVTLEPADYAAPATAFTLALTNPASSQTDSIDVPVDT